VGGGEDGVMMGAVQESRPRPLEPAHPRRPGAFRARSMAALVPPNVFVAVVADDDMMTERGRPALDDPPAGVSDVKGKRPRPLKKIEPGANHRSDTRLDPRHPLSIQSAQFRPGEAVRSTNRTREPADRRGNCTMAMTLSCSSRSSYQIALPERTAAIHVTDCRLRGAAARPRSRVCVVGRGPAQKSLLTLAQTYDISNT
jgi:hypothetical protein